MSQLSQRGVTLPPNPTIHTKAMRYSNGLAESEVMASNLECVGLGVPSDGLGALVASVHPRAVRFGKVGGVELLRWQDESGARLVLVIEDGQVVDLLPSFASSATTRLGQLRLANDDVVTAAVLDEAGDQLTSVAFELEQRRLLTAGTVDAVVGSFALLGRRVTVHSDEDAFADSPSSLLDLNVDPDAPAPPEYAERGLKWPLRVAAESFFSHGVFGDPSDATAGARFAGVIVSAERRVVELTAQTFIVAQIETTGIKASVCLSGTEFESIPQPGQVLAGEAFVVGSISDLESSTPRRRWWRGRP